MSKPIGIYVRVSRKGDREDERFHSPREQAERATALAIAKGFTPGPVFEDIDVSGAKAPADRPAMGRLLASIGAGELGGIAAYSLDRLSRDPGHGDLLVRAVTKAGGVLLTPDMPEAIDSPTGEFTFGMLLQVAKLYRATAGARFESAKDRSIRAGIPVSEPPIGFRRGADRRLEQDPDTAPAVRALFERYAAGATQGSLLALLAEATGRPWSRQAVPGIIRNRLYATGRLEYGGTVSEHAAEPIVDEALWHAAQRAPRPQRPPRSTEPWLLSGLLKCAGCGRNLSPTRIKPYTRKSDGYAKEYRAYKCPNRACTAKGHAMADLIEPWTVARTFERVQAVVGATTAPDLAPLEEALSAAERRLGQVLGPEAQDALGDAWAPTAKVRRQERDRAAEALGVARQAEGTPGVDVHLPELWGGLSITDRRAALALLWLDIRVGRKPKGATGRPITLVARGPLGEAEITINTKEAA